MIQVKMSERQQPRSLFKLIVILLVVLSGCAPGLGKNLNVNAASAGPRDEAVQFFSNPVRLHIMDIRDVRDEVFIGSIGGRKLLPQGNIPQEAIELVKKSFAPRGVSFSPAASVQIVGAIREWFVEVTTGFPMSRAEARAALEIEVINEDQGVQYRATYSGTANLEHPFMREKNIEEVLGWALQSTIDSAIEDGEFLAAIGVL